MFLPTSRRGISNFGPYPVWLECKSTYPLAGGGKFLNISATALSIFFSSFSGFPDKVSLATPRQINFCVELSNMSTISVPTGVFSTVVVASPSSKPCQRHPPPNPVYQVWRVFSFFVEPYAATEASPPVSTFVHPFAVNCESIERIIRSSRSGSWTLTLIQEYVL